MPRKVNRVALGQPPGTCTWTYRAWFTLYIYLYIYSLKEFQKKNSIGTCYMFYLCSLRRDNDNNSTFCCTALIRYCWNYIIIDIMTCWVRHTHANYCSFTLYGPAIRILRRYGLSGAYCVLPRWDTVWNAGIIACNKVDQTRPIPHIDCCRNT